MILGHLGSYGDINKEVLQPGMTKAHKSMRLVATGWNSGIIASKRIVAPVSSTACASCATTASCMTSLRPPEKQTTAW